jgi:hypothetical protein
MEDTVSAEGKGISITTIEPLSKDIEQRAIGSILFVPDNWSAERKEHVYPSTVDSVVKLLKQNKVTVDTLDPIDAATALQDNRGLDWIMPTFVVSSLLLTQNPMLTSVALSVIAKYVTDLFKGLKDDPEIKLNIIQTAADGKKAQSIRYEGPVSGLPGVEKVLKTFDPKE